MKKSLAAMSAVAAILLTGCGATEATRSTWETPLPGARDEAVGALLPQGAFTVTGGFTKSSGAITTIEGYVNFGTEPDGIACESDYTITAEQSAGWSFASAVRAVRTAGSPNWMQDVSDPNAPSEWLDNSDPDAKLIPLLFVPAVIAQDWNPGVLEGAGTGELCSIAVMPRFMSITDGQLTYDRERAAAAIRAGRARWVEQFVDATGVTGAKRDEAVKMLVELATASYSTLMDRTSVSITKNDDGSYVITQSSTEGGSGTVQLTLTPTDPRTITPVTARTYFEKVHAEMLSSGLSPEEFLRTKQ